ncbi:MAG: hypothetical protein L0241_25785 [Planctomycetia bacterium]|nr:hypothetical protein [Planctomycetia bacterium]
MSASLSAEEPNSEEPKGLIEKLGAALPVGLTALATIFASMSTGALQEAMYWKSQAAQDQAKSTSQWSLAGFKRDRALMMQAAAAQLYALCGYAIPQFDSTQDTSDPNTQKALAWLTNSKAGPPPERLPEIEDQSIKELRDAIAKREPETELLKKAARVDKAKINKTIDDAEKKVEQIDKDWEPVVKKAEGLVRTQTAIKLDGKATPEEKAAKIANAQAAQAAGFDMEERRYRAESRLNQGIGFLYEIRTKVSAAESDRYRRKSEFLSYAMLVAQIGAVASSLALARKRKSALWFFAGMVGLVAIGVGGYALIPHTLLGF